eukprot:scaffold280236_cov23-Tisochrysis_lutea.AAC.2
MPSKLLTAAPPLPLPPPWSEVLDPPKRRPNCKAMECKTCAGVRRIAKSLMCCACFVADCIPNWPASLQECLPRLASVLGWADLAGKLLFAITHEQ